MLWNLIQDIEPLDLSVIQKDVAPETVDAMKRTISGMLGLLPSDQFRVIVEALWNPFFKLLVSSIMTGYIFYSPNFSMMVVVKIISETWLHNQTHVCLSCCSVWNSESTSVTCISQLNGM
jgi:hypothetical protein